MERRNGRQGRSGKRGRKRDPKFILLVNRFERDLDGTGGGEKQAHKRKARRKFPKRGMQYLLNFEQADQSKKKKDEEITENVTRSWPEHTLEKKRDGKTRVL